MEIIKITFLSILIGIISSILSVIILEYLKKQKLRNQLKKYEGKWTSHPEGKNSNPNEDILWGEVEIIWENKNILTIYHKNMSSKKVGRDWSGKIIINEDYIDTGRIIWQYVETSDYSDIGYKELLLKEKGNHYLLYLIGVNYGN